MSDDLQKLRDIGAQKIFEKTHIAHKHAQALLHESFEGMNRIQFLGFISILEREYHVNLSELKEKGEKFFSDLRASEHIYHEELLSNKKNNSKKIYALFVIIGLLVGSYYIFTKPPTKTTFKAIDNTTIESVQKVIDDNKSYKEDINVTSETTVTQNEEENSSFSTEQNSTVTSFIILPRSKVWLGYIDLETHKKKQLTFADRLELDPKKDWLLTFGHGYVDIDLNGEKKHFKKAVHLRFLYKDGSLEKISLDQFKELNEGKGW